MYMHTFVSIHAYLRTYRKVGGEVHTGKWGGGFEDRRCIVATTRICQSNCWCESGCGVLSVSEGERGVGVVGESEGGVGGDGDGVRRGGEGDLSSKASHALKSHVSLNISHQIGATHTHHGVRSLV